MNNANNKYVKGRLLFQCSKCAKLIYLNKNIFEASPYNKGICIQCNNASA